MNEIVASVFAVNAYRHVGVALATLIEIRGVAARALRSHVVVATDGRFCGYVSGGCVEVGLSRCAKDG